MLNEAEVKEAAISLRDMVEKSTGMRRFVYTKESMNPFLVKGDNVIVGPIRPEELRLGDIIVYKQGTAFVVHRFLGIKNNMGASLRIISKADNSVRKDPLLDPSNLIGRAREIYKNEKRIKLENKQWRVISSIMGAMSASEAFLFNAVVNLKKRFFKIIPVNAGTKRGLERFLRVPKSLITIAVTYFFRR